MFLQTLEKAQGQITSAQAIKGRPTILTTAPPPGWKWPESSATELRLQVTPDNTIVGNGTDEEEETEPLVEDIPAVKLRDPQDHGDGNSRSIHIFSKRKMYNTRLTKYWIVRHGGPLLSPPLEVDARHCLGPALFINIPTNGDKQLWLWNVQECKWDPTVIGHVVDLDVKRVLTLSKKNAPVFKAVRERQEPRNEVRFIQCQP